MKKTIKFLIAAIAVSGLAKAQASPMLVTLEEITTQDPTWVKSFIYSYTPNQKTEPKVDPLQVDFFKRTLSPLIEAKQINEALEAIEEEIKGDDNPPALYCFTAGNFYWTVSADQKDEAAVKECMRKALDYYKKAIKAHPSYLRAHKNMAQLYMQLDQPEKAKKHFIEAIKLGDRDSTTMGILGYIYQNEGNYVSAEAALRQALIIDPDNKNFNLLLSQSLSAQGRYEEANSLLEELLKKDPNNTDLWLAQVNAFLGLEEVDKAAVNIEMVRIMSSADPQILKLLGNIYIGKEMFDLATDTFITSINQNPHQNVKDSINAVQTLINFASYANAERLIDSIESNYINRLSEEDNKRLLTLKAEVKISTDRGDEAVAHLEEVLRLDPLNGQALLSLANYYSNDLNLAQKAILYYQRAESLENKKIKSQAFIRHAQLMVKEKEYAEAIKLLQTSLDIQENENVEAYLDSVKKAYKTIRALN